MCPCVYCVYKTTVICSLNGYTLYTHTSKEYNFWRCVCSKRKMDAFIFTLILKLKAIFGSSMYLGVFSFIHAKTHVHCHGAAYMFVVRKSGWKTCCISSLDTVHFLALIQVSSHSKEIMWKVQNNVYHLFILHVLYVLFARVVECIVKVV